MKIHLLYYFNTSPLFVSCIMLYRNSGEKACAVICQWKVFLKTSHIFLSSRGVWFVPFLLPFHIPSQDKSHVGGLHPLMTNLLWSRGTLLYVVSFCNFPFLNSHLWEKTCSSCESTHGGVNGRKYPCFRSSVWGRGVGSKSVPPGDDHVPGTVR